MQNRWCFLQQHHIEDTSSPPFSSVVRSTKSLLRVDPLIWPTAAASSITSLLHFILHWQLITSLEALYLICPADICCTGDSEDIGRGQELDLDSETTAGINKQNLAWVFKFFSITVWFIFFEGSLLLPPGNQHDRHNFDLTYCCCRTGEHFKPFYPCCHLMATLSGK